jgi:hypothetical protein
MPAGPESGKGPDPQPGSGSASCPFAASGPGSCVSLVLGSAAGESAFAAPEAALSAAPADGYDDLLVTNTLFHPPRP